MCTIATGRKLEESIIHISKQLLSWGDTYAIDINDPADELDGLMLVIAIDAANCTQGAS